MNQDDMKLHGKYTPEDVVSGLDLIDSIKFITRHRQQLMVVHTKTREYVFKVLDGNRVELIERN